MGFFTKNEKNKISYYLASKINVKFVCLKKLFIELENNEKSLLIGIVSDENMVRIVWLLNQTMTYNLSRNNDIVLENQTGKAETRFAKFDFEDLENHLTFTFFNNKDGKQFLIAELKKIDYFLSIRGGIEFINIAKLLKKMKSINEIRLVTEIDQSKLKSNLSLLL